MKTISIVTACYNEADNVGPLVEAVKTVFAGLKDYDYEHIFIDNCSEDNTVAVLREICKTDKKVRVIVNSRNFGHIRSPFHGLLAADGDAVMSLVADFQDPPELIPQFIAEWEKGYPIVIGVKEKSSENRRIFFIRNLYYRMVRRMSEVKLIDGFTGFGLYDHHIIEILRGIKDPYPYFRGLVSEIGFEKSIIEYTQPDRRSGKTKNNFLTLFDMAMTGFTSTSRIPMRIASMAGFVMSLVSLIIALVYLVLKLVRWQSFLAGTAPILIGVFFFASIQLFFIGVLGEYISAINTRVLNRPHVIEKERINFKDKKSL